MKLSVEKAYFSKLVPSMPMWSWAVRHAAFLYNRFARRASGTTAFQGAYGHAYMGLIVPFGECVLAKIGHPDHRGLRGGQRLHKGDPQWKEGVWLGKSTLNDENIVGTFDGIMRCRTIRRVEKDARAQFPLYKGMKGVPWNDGTGILRGRPPKQHAPPLVRPVPVQVGGSSGSAGESGSTVFPAAVNTENKKENTKDDKEEDNEDQVKKKAKQVNTPDKKDLDADMVTPTRLDMDQAADAPAAEGSGMVVDDSGMDASAEREDRAKARARVAVLCASLADTAWPETMESKQPQCSADELGPGSLDDSNPLVIAGKAEELARCKEFQTFKVVPWDEVAADAIKITARWEKSWKWKPEKGWFCRARYVGREYRWMEVREDLFAPSATSDTARVIDVIALREGWSTSTADATNAFYHAPEHEDVAIPPPP